MTDNDKAGEPTTEAVEIGNVVTEIPSYKSDGGKYAEVWTAADEIETLIYWLLRCYQSGHREGWEPGLSTQEVMDRVLDVLANRGYDPNEDQAAKDLIAKMEKR